MEETIEQKNKKYIHFFNRLYPWFSGLTGDLLFYIAIDTLFLTLVKGLSAAQIVFITTISSVVCILLRRFILAFIKKVGNTNALRWGTILALFSIAMITFSTSYWQILIAESIREISNVLKGMQGALLKNNLTYIGKEDDYVLMKNKSNIIYSVITGGIAFVTGFMFDANPYLPMLFSIACCLICCFMAFGIKEVNQDEKKEIRKENRSKSHNSVFILINIISYGLFFAAVVVGQQNGKLFIQYELTKTYSMVLTASYLGIIVAISRIARIIANISFGKLYKKYGDKVSVGLNLGLVLSFICFIVGYFISEAMPIKFTVMAIGFCFILAVRDLYKTYMEGLLLKYCKKEEQQEVLTRLEFSRRIGVVIISLIASAILMKFNLLFVVLGLLGLALVEFVVNFGIYKIIKQQK